MLFFAGFLRLKSFADLNSALSYRKEIMRLMGAE